ncbi:MAG: hypothetical protein AB7H93_18345 [Vicinamibacterales bacterium]
MTTSLLLAVALAAGQTAAPPPAPADARWQPWLGGWVADDDRAGTGARTCVTATPDGGVSIVTSVGVQEISRESRIADDRDYAVAVDDCRGTERHRWSANGRRLYRTATVACGSEAPRTLASVAFMRNGPVWVDVQTVQQGADTSVRVQRYRPAPRQRQAAGSAVAQPAFDFAEMPWTVNDVLELSAALPADGVQAAIGEGTTAFDLNKRTLVALADARVDERVIDLMVGLTYPNHFVVRSGGGSADSGGYAGGAFDPFFAPIVGAAAMYGCYSPYGWAAAGYFGNCGMMSPYLLGYGPGYWNGYYNSSWWVANGPVNPAGGGGPAPQAEGRVVNGRGYTQVTPVDATNAGSGGAWNGGNGGTSSSNSGGSSGVSSGGYSGGGMSGGDGGRMAMPRPPGV